MILKKLAILTVVLLVSLCIFSCGIEENYFLPEVPEVNVIRDLNTGAKINVPGISSEYYYANSYAIFYRIYVSNYATGSSTDINPISNVLSNDYSYFENISSITNTTTVMSLSHFKTMNYYELEFEEIEKGSILPKIGGSLYIDFSSILGREPTISLNDGQKYKLQRSGELNFSKPSLEDNPYFQNTEELLSYEYANSNINADVSGQNTNPQYAYVSMYIVAVGTHPTNFTPIVSKPTHINVFRLPDAN